MGLHPRFPGYAEAVNRSTAPETPGHDGREPSAAPTYSLALQLRLVDLGLAEVVVIDGVPGVQVDPIFEAARAAALAGFLDRDQADAAAAEAESHVLDLRTDVPALAGHRRFR